MTVEQAVRVVGVCSNCGRGLRITARTGALYADAARGVSAAGYNCSREVERLVRGAGEDEVEIVRTEIWSEHTLGDRGPSKVVEISRPTAEANLHVLERLRREQDQERADAIAKGLKPAVVIDSDYQYTFAGVQGPYYFTDEQLAGAAKVLSEMPDLAYQHTFTIYTADEFEGQFTVDGIDSFHIDEYLEARELLGLPNEEEEDEDE